MNVLVATLNHNLPALTDNMMSLVQQDLKQGKSDHIIDGYDVMVIDNGSNKAPKAEQTTHTLTENTYFGGGFNLILTHFLQGEWDYLAVLNNDLLWFPKDTCISRSFRVLHNSEADLMSPAILNASINQCHWKQMWNWGTHNYREVKFIDFQAPFMSRRLVEMIKQYPEELFLGWGLDFYTGLFCDGNQMLQIVYDGITLTHLNSQTFEQGVIDIGIRDFCLAADRNMLNYFKNDPQYFEMRLWGEQYSY